MLVRLGVKLSLIMTMSLLGLFLAACDQSTTGTGYDSSSTAQVGATPSAMPNMDSGAAVNRPPKADTAANTKATPKMNQNQVVIENFAFSPATLTVKSGTKVTWVNRDDVPHTATENDKRFNSGTLDTDGEFSFTFNTPGTYKYFCALHPRMTAQIIVK